MQPINAYRITLGGSLHLTIRATTFDELTHRLPQGFYTTFRTYDGGKRVLGLKAHLERLYKPATLLKINPTVSIETLRHQMAEILGNYPDEARVRLVMTKDGDIFIALTALIPLPSEIYLSGVKTITTDVQRENPRLKSTAFIAASENTRAQIADGEIFEALLVRKGTILEGMTSNFFYVKDGLLGTARNHILLGVTRRTVLRVIRRIGFDVGYRPLKREQVAALSEAFLTSSSRGIVPIIQIDDISVGEGGPGPVTRNLMDGYKLYVRQHADII